MQIYKFQCRFGKIIPSAKIISKHTFQKTTTPKNTMPTARANQRRRARWQALMRTRIEVLQRKKRSKIVCIAIRVLMNVATPSDLAYMASIKGTEKFKNLKYRHL